LLYNAIDRLDYVGHTTPTKDYSGHGTEVASIIAGKWTGVAKRATIKAVQVLGSNGNGKNSDLIHALEWVATHRTGPSIIHLSLGGPKSRVLDEVVATMTAGDIPVIIAAGNADRDACDFRYSPPPTLHKRHLITTFGSPGGSRKAITVGAMTQSDMRADYSNYGSCLSIFAPGDSILAATQPTTQKIATRPPYLLEKSATKSESNEKYLGDLTAIQPSAAAYSLRNMSQDDELNMEPIELGYNEGYILSSGTSMAAPLVTGVFALLMEKYPGKSASQLWEMVQALAVNNILDPSTLKGSPNIILQAPKYDPRNRKILIPGLDVDDDDGTREDGGKHDFVGGSSFLPGLSLKIALFVLFIFIAVIILGLCILYWVLQALQHRTTQRQSPATLIAAAAPDASSGSSVQPMFAKEPKDFEDELGYRSPILDIRIECTGGARAAAIKAAYKPPSPTPTV
jgi:subtilisin family serine protease